jgi:hypothetical protein
VYPWGFSGDGEASASGDIPPSTFPQVVEEARAAGLERQHFSMQLHIFVHALREGSYNGRLKEMLGFGLNNKNN